ncbi:MAG: LuxR C-terminal-related transcriptional regulator [Bacteroidales bacterium]|jgi:LuxR family maltose regulon positive regulatory protein|nr:LuxR C-terminal-related transcriptional regulator [Bacteroidales bacterium]
MLLTKLHIPPASQNIVHRQELYEKLNIGLTRKLILISAPAGFGKTTVVSDWIGQNNFPAAWFSLDNGDNDPVDFLSYIISGIQSIHTTFGQGALKLLNSPNRPSGESIAGLLINEILNINQNFLLVLDDFHLIKSNEVLKLVSYLLEHIPGNIHIVILTRSDPALSVSRLRSQHQLVELRSSDLSFSANDISVLFNKKLKLGLSVEDIYSLETKTEGWIAGLQLTALSMRGRENISEFIQDLKGDNRYIMDYLMEEVLKIQSDDIEEFLLQTSILEQMSAPLCNAVLNRNDSQSILETLERNNMFVIPLDSERTWYRYHHLFAELLKQRLHLRDKTAIIELHNKAGDWFYTNSMPLLAIEHALKTENFEKSILFLGEIVETMWQNGQHTAILKYGDLLPDELIKKSADFCLYYSWILIIAGQIQKAEPFLVSAEIITMQIINDKDSSKKDVQYNKKLLGKISVAFAYLYSITKDPGKTFSYGKAAMENLSDDDPLWYSWGWYSIGIAEMSRENFTECIKAFESALVYGKKSGNIYLISTIASRLSPLEKRMGLYKTSYKRCSDLINLMKESGYAQIIKSESTYALLYTCMAGIESMRTDFDDALENIKPAYSLCKNESDNSFKVYVLVVYALTLYGRGDITGVKKMLNEMDDILRINIVFPSFMALYIAMKGLMLVEQNELEKANQFFKENGLEYDNKISYLDEFAYCPYALLLITEKKFEEAEILLSKLLRMAQTANRIERVIETKVIYAVLNKATGNKETAIINLIEALEDAASENILMSFILFYSGINDLLKEVYKIQATTKTKIPKELINKLKLAIEKKEKFMKNNLGSGLSDRELDTLKLIAEDLSNREIADKLFISLNTAKTHVRNILLKLDVENRSQAVTKAKEQGII